MVDASPALLLAPGLHQELFLFQMEKIISFTRTTVPLFMGLPFSNMSDNSDCAELSA
jgi:hypothetical protein